MRRFFLLLGFVGGLCLIGFLIASTEAELRGLGFPLMFAGILAVASCGSALVRRPQRRPP